MKSIVQHPRLSYSFSDGFSVFSIACVLTVSANPTRQNPVARMANKFLIFNKFRFINYLFKGK